MEVPAAGILGWASELAEVAEVAASCWAAAEAEVASTGGKTHPGSG